jgi:hypothetical protein
MRKQILVIGLVGVLMFVVGLSTGFYMNPYHAQQTQTTQFSTSSMNAVAAATTSMPVSIEMTTPSAKSGQTIYPMALENYRCFHPVATSTNQLSDIFVGKVNKFIGESPYLTGTDLGERGGASMPYDLYEVEVLQSLNGENMTGTVTLARGIYDSPEIQISIGETYVFYTSYAANKNWYVFASALTEARCEGPGPYNTTGYQ